MHRKLSTVIAYLSLCLCWGSAWTGNEVLAGRIPILRSGAIRFGVGALLLGLVAVLRRSPMPRGGALRGHLVLGVTLLALPYGLVVLGGQRSSAVLPVLLFAALPLFAGVLGIGMRAPVAPRHALQAALIALGGVALVLSNGLFVSFADAWGGIAIFLAVGSHAVSLIYAKRLLRDAPILSATALQLGVAAVVLGLWSFAIEHGQPSQWDPSAVTAVLALAVVGSGIGFALYFWLLGRMEPYQVASVQWVLPLVAIGEGAIAAHEAPPWEMMVGAGIIFACLWAIFRAGLDGNELVTFQVTDGPFNRQERNLR